MRHRILTCKNHPDLRWSCKEIAWTNRYGYNGNRTLFFNGIPSGKGMYDDSSGLDCTMFKGDEMVKVCTCPPTDLIIAPEDKLVTC